MRTTAQVLVDCLEAEGVDVIFGIPGEETLDLMFAIRDSKIRFIPVRHEQGAAFMADVYGRLTGRAGVCLSTLGPGATNLVTGVADAYLDGAPLVAITGQVGTDRMQLTSHQYLDLTAMFEPITKRSKQIIRPDTVGEIVRLAFKHAEKGKPDDLAYRVRADDLFGTLGDGLKHGGQIQILVAGQLHPVGAHLPRDGHQRRTIQISICHARDQVGGTGAQGGQADTGPPGQTAIDIRHKGRALLMTHRNKTNFAVPDGEHQVQCLLARDAEDHIDSLGFQTVYQHLGCRSHLSFLFHSYFPDSIDPNAKGSAAPHRATLPFSASYCN